MEPHVRDFRVGRTGVFFGDPVSSLRGEGGRSSVLRRTPPNCRRTGDPGRDSLDILDAKSSDEAIRALRTVTAVMKPSQKVSDWRGGRDNKPQAADRGGR
jgi:hypothetical protein